MRHDAKRNRERILAAAEQVFGEHGAAGSTEEVARRAEVGIATVFRHFPTKEALIEAALLGHYADLTERATALAAHPDAATALYTLIRDMVGAGATKITLASLVSEFPPDARAASHALRDVVDVALRRAQAAGVAREEIRVEEVFLLIRGLAQASAIAPATTETLRRATDVVLTGILVPPSAPHTQSHVHRIPGR